MSLDLSNKAGRAHNTTNITDPSTVVLATLDSGDVADAGSFLLLTDTAAGNIDASTMVTTFVLADGSEAFSDGFEVTFIKVTPDGNRITFVDPVTLIDYQYVNKQGESITLVYDSSTGTPRWLAKV